MWLIALVLASVAGAAWAAPTFPPLTGRVTDAAHVLPPETAAALDAKLAALETATGTQLVVATVPSLGGLPIEDYGYQLGRAWGIGQKGTNNGVILLVAPSDRKVRIETGYGLEARLTDALSETIIRRDIIPAFKVGDMPGGIVAGTDALIAQLQLPPGEARAQVAAAEAQPRAERRHASGSGFSGLFWLAIVLVWIFFSIFRGRRGTRSASSGIGNAILWGVASEMLSGRGRGGSGWGGGGWGGGGGGGGGFSGGGGSFGGGGASGGW